MLKKLKSVWNDLNDRAHGFPVAEQQGYFGSID